MYRIGDFSKITNLTIKTLHYYDEEGILVPSSREENGYRYYDERNFETAALIVFLRDLDFGIAEIKNLLAAYKSEADLSHFLNAKKSMIERRIRKDEELIKKIDRFIKPKNMLHTTEYAIELKNIEPINVAFIRYKGRYQDTGDYLSKIYKGLKGHATKSPFNCYYESGYNETADIEVCVPTNKIINTDRIKTKKLPGIKALCTVHRGSYEFFNFAYKALLDYASKNKLECGLPTREIYHKGPGLLFIGNTDEYITEIMVPVIN